MKARCFACLWDHNTHVLRNRDFLLLQCSVLTPRAVFIMSSLLFASLIDVLALSFECARLNRLNRLLWFCSACVQDVSFPRGGAEALTKQERQEIEAQARAELDEEEAAAGGVVPRSKKLKQVWHSGGFILYRPCACSMWGMWGWTLGVQSKARSQPFR